MVGEPDRGGQETEDSQTLYTGAYMVGARTIGNDGHTTGPDSLRQLVGQS
jgi:methionine-rich copper-binding protein CopC